MNKNLSFLLFLLTFSITGGPMAAEAQTPAQQSFRLGQEAMKATPANYKAPLDSLRKNKPAADDPKGIDIHAHAMSIYQSYATNYDSVLYYFDQQALEHLNKQVDKGADTEFAKESYFRNAITALPNKLETHRIVMLNEAPYMPSVLLPSIC